MSKTQEGSAAALPERVSGLVERILQQNPMHRKVVSAAAAELERDEVSALEGYLEFCDSVCGLDLDYMCDSYLTIVKDTLRELVYFQKFRKFRHESFAEVAPEVYFDGDYMARYMYGLGLTTFFWRNHRDMMRFFRRTLPRGHRGKYLEVGPGHGLFFKTAIQESAYDRFDAVDISETSVSLTRRIVDAYGKGKGKQANVVVEDFLTADIQPGSYNAVAMGEVLEHVERPDVFMKRLAAIAAPDPWIFVTTCCNAPAVDHISLFRNSSEVEALFTGADLKVVESLILPFEGQTMQKCIEQELPVNVAYVLTKS